MKQRLICRFAHDFTKLWGQTSARLLDVKRINSKDIDFEAKHYDTLYFSERQPMFFGFEDGQYLRMTFIGNKGIPFTTYRTDTPEHLAKYVNNIGREFEIVVEK